MKLGFIPTEGGRFYREALDEVVLGEELGFDSVWMEEHHGIKNHYWPSPLVVLAGFAARTSTIRLGTDVVVLPFHHPVKAAEDAAMVDVISNGRLTLGVAPKMSFVASRNWTCVSACSGWNTAGTLLASAFFFA